jgi:hypothetical protein
MGKTLGIAINSVLIKIATSGEQNETPSAYKVTQVVNLIPPLRYLLHGTLNEK